MAKNKMLVKTKKKVALTVCVLCLVLLSYLQFGREMKVYSSYSISADNYQCECLSIVLNRLVVIDKEECAHEIVRHCINNDVNNIIFSYDYDFPNELEVTAYLSEMDLKLRNPLFSFEYKPENNEDYQYDIINDADKTVLIMSQNDRRIQKTK